MSAVIFQGSAVKALKNEIKFFTAGSIQSGTVDPTSVAVSADSGSLYENTSTGNVYKKNDNGSTTNWSQLATTATAAPDSSYDLNNLGLATSVASNELTISLKDKSGSNPSGGSPVKIGFRDTTITNGTFVSRSVTSSLSLVITSGSTLGHQDAVDRYIYVYALDNAGTVALGVSSAHFEDGSLVTTVAEGGAGGADSNSSMYSASVLSGVACRLIGLLVSNQTTAGTWAANMTSIQIVPFDLPAIACQVKLPSDQTIPNVTTTLVSISTEMISDKHGLFNVTNNEIIVNKPGKYRVYSKISSSGNTTTIPAFECLVKKNGTTDISEFTMFKGSDTNTLNTRVCVLTNEIVDLAADDLITLHTFQNSGGNFDISGTDPLNTLLGIEYIGK